MLTPGTTLGPYKIRALIGAGGMGEVYRAHDARLGRDVAIKVLAARLAATPEVRARFEREARTISQLSHPHICVLYDVGRTPCEAGSGETDYLVMELLEGETLARRLAKGPLPVAELLEVGVQIADALDRAHRAGVVHRDLKPGNVMLTRGGAKLMDFGLARAAGMAGAPSALSDSPTVSRPLTAEGTIVGTFQYMAPEQLEGKEADARTDLWALGCVLYEMATGRKAFEGKTQASLIAAIMERQPSPPSQTAPLLPPALDRVVQQCLTKDADERIQTAHDVKLELRLIAESRSQAAAVATPTARRRGRERAAWGVAGAALALAAAAAVLSPGLPLLRRSVPPRLIRFDLRPPRGATSLAWPRVSPDGRTLAFLASDSTGVQRVWVRPLDAVEARPLEGVQNARPFWSPDSRYLAFFTEGKLRKIPVAGGPAVTICDAPGGFDGTWGRSGWILFDGSVGDSIRGVRATGGIPRGVTTLDRARGETQHSWPYFLPDGRHFLFVVSRPGSPEAIHLGRLDSRESRPLGTTENRVEYASPGHLVYVNGGTLVSQPFDAGSARTAGDPVPVGEIVDDGVGPFSVSSAGVVAYQARVAQAQARLAWVARDGRPLGEAAPAGSYEDVALSPDGGRLAYTAARDQAANLDVWVRDLARGVSSRLTFDEADEIMPVWSPDGTRIAFARFCPRLRCFVRAANGAGPEDSLAHDPTLHETPIDWSASADALLVSHIDLQNKWDVWLLPAAGHQASRPLLQAPFNERWGRLSPDGRWLAYASDESGRDEVYVIPFAGPGGKWQVSTSGGSFPQWRADGRELFFQGAAQNIMAVDVNAAAGFDLGVPKLLFRTTTTAGKYLGYRWAVSRDGQRFLVVAPSGPSDAGRFVVVVNWAEAQPGR